MKKCKQCQSEIDPKAKICPHCGKRQGSNIILIGIVAVIVLFVLAGVFGNDTTKEASSDNIKEENVSEKEEQKEEVPTEYKNALIKAESYSEMMHMSKQGIYDQLTSEYGEQFPAEAAQYAIDNIDADWKENALAKAKDYQETMNMSKDAIYDQLVSEYGEKFTAEEAQYAVDNLE